IARLNQPHELRTDLRHDPDVAGEAVDHAGEQRALVRGLRRDHADYAVLAVLRRWLDGRLHANEGHAGEGSSEVVQARRRRRVAGNDDHFGVPVEEKPRNGLHKAPDFLQRPGAVGDVPLVREIEHVFVGEATPDFAEDGQAAYPGVKHGDWACIGHSNTLPAGDGAGQPWPGKKNGETALPDSTNNTSGARSG